MPRGPTRHLKNKALDVLENAAGPVSSEALAQDIGCNVKVAMRTVQELRLCGARIRRVTGYVIEKGPPT